ncbi:MAG: hypothetical protein KME30_20020 [Iphinoe sp. HA4291-MV1]|jgi:hypothetical protein|nr:hypothetical protein [Iphinoe sp. HA4291-MV1]
MSAIKISDLSQDSFLTELSDAEMQVQGGGFYDYTYYNFNNFGQINSDDVGTVGFNFGESNGEKNYYYYY